MWTIVVRGENPPYLYYTYGPFDSKAIAEAWAKDNLPGHDKDRDWHIAAHISQ